MHTAFKMEAQIFLIIVSAIVIARRHRATGATRHPITTSDNDREGVRRESYLINDTIHIYTSKMLR